MKRYTKDKRYIDTRTRKLVLKLWYAFGVRTSITCWTRKPWPFQAKECIHSTNALTLSSIHSKCALIVQTPRSSKCGQALMEVHFASWVAKERTTHQSVRTRPCRIAVCMCVCVWICVCMRVLVILLCLRVCMCVCVWICVCVSLSYCCVYKCVNLCVCVLVILLCV